MAMGLQRELTKRLRLNRELRETVKTGMEKALKPKEVELLKGLGYLQ